MPAARTPARRQSAGRHRVSGPNSKALVAEAEQSAPATSRNCRRRPSEEEAPADASRPARKAPRLSKESASAQSSRLSARPSIAFTSSSPLTSRDGGVRLCTAAFEFELPYTEDWLELFDERMEQVLRDIEDAAIPQDLLAAFSLTIADESGVVLVNLATKELEASGIPVHDLFGSRREGVSAHFPLKVRFGPASFQSGPSAICDHPVEDSTASEADVAGCPSLPISPAGLHEEFLRNLSRKPLRLGGPVSLARIEELCEILTGGEGKSVLQGCFPGGLEGDFCVSFVPVLVQQGQAAPL
eukprot:TRINITY_DN23423_c0_g1_i1.p1 TRINITY_DN23423_c0_g1~~TRINITY_DN23423_c0_g1_i1.p1  ORF type:complete len:300 (+),score=50.36 TRINITY_DN23423_c0_g1_i1:71-970(+)